MLAVLSGHTECVYSLLSKGANVEAKDRWGRTALHRGVRLSHTLTPMFNTRLLMPVTRPLLPVTLLVCFL